MPRHFPVVPRRGALTGTEGEITVSADGTQAFVHDGKTPGGIPIGQGGSASAAFTDTVAPAYLKTISDVANGMEISLARFINPAKFAAIQQGNSTYNVAADLNSAFTSGAASLFAPRGIYKFSGDLSPLGIGMILRGAGGGEYTTQGASTQGLTIFERQDTGTANSAVLTLSDGSTVETLQVRPVNWQAANYSFADYPGGTGNCAIGVKMGSQTAQARHVNAMSFSKAGFLLGTTSVLERCYAYMCDRGYMVDPNGATDGTLLNCVGMFCNNAGADLQMNYWTVIGGRWEWNARYGIIAGAENTIVGALFDRNGMAGLCFAAGQWGKVVSGNYFSRNGVGGDGTAGRWDFATPGSAAYVAVPAGLSCHIQIDYEHAATITGNRYRSGRDDGNAGADGPQFIYGSAAGNGATPINALRVVGNMGDGADHSVPGYTAAYNGVANSGAVAGGTDSIMANMLNAGGGLDRPVTGVASRLYAGDQSAPQNGSSFVVQVLRNTSGKITVRSATSGATNLFDVYFGSNAADAGYTTAIANLLGTASYSTAVMAQDTTDPRYNKVTITLTAARWYDYTVYST